MKMLLLAAGLFAIVGAALARPFTVVAYNVENLMDVDGITRFADYDSSKYTRAHALTKLKNIASVLARFDGGAGPDVLILAELEVDFSPAKAPPDYAALLARYQALTIDEMLGARFTPEIADLPAELLLAKALTDRGINGHRVVVAENLTAAGTARELVQKCAIFTRFPVRTARSHPTTDARAILEAQLEVEGAVLYVFANHWKSGASDAATEPTRIANARTLRARLDEIFRRDPHADVVIGGDLNSHHNHRQRHAALKTTGINDVLRSQGNELAVRGPDRDLYNLWYELPPSSRGSDTYRGEWGTLIHLIVSRGLYDYRGVQYVDNSFAVAKFAGLNADAKGLPHRWTFSGPGGGGFSDHFPVSARFVTVPDGRTDRFLELRAASVEETGRSAPPKVDFAQVDLAAHAVRAEQLPARTNIRSDAYRGKLFRVEGRVPAGSRLAVEFRGDTYDVWSYDEALRTRLRAEFAEGATIRFYGELGQFRGRWQFVIQDASWVK